ncbi:MAG: dienelactone hydrolase family protein [Hyphomonadaceae bacterium]|nr:dienelactone hydrolase family protein [Hyphomonadaceae bacterium]MBP9233445.1 dienelactone hydrolase family protein [Hyphomonadaceae bacterium]
MRLESIRLRFPAVVACGLLSLLSLAATAQDAADTLPLTPGVYHLNLARAGEPTVGYAISVPPDYSSSTPVPLILALHFGVGGGSATGAGGDMLDILVGPGLASLGAIIVAPDSVRGNWSTPENEKAVTALIDAVTAGYAVDRKKIAVTGFSMGGSGSWHFAQKFPEIFSAAIPIASRPPESAAGWKVPVFAIHSRDDQVAPFTPADTRIAELQKAGVNARMIALAGISHYQTHRFQDALRQAAPWLHEVWK